MSLHIICPGCLKRFKVGVRFAGMKGACPNCGEIISIPKETVKMHGPGEGRVVAESRRVHRPFPRLDLDFDPVQVQRYAWGVLGVLLLTFLLGCLPMPGFLRAFVGVTGLCLIAFPLTLFGYQIMLDREHIFAFAGVELHRRAGIVAGGYVLLWLCFECLLAATRADVFVSGLYFAALAALATLLVHPLLELKTWDALLHYCIFSFPVVLLRFLLGFGWFWQSSEWIRYSTAPPPPVLLGM